MMKESEAYLITDTHLRLGSKIHIIDYVYAKRLFQKSFYATKFAYILAKNIFNSLIQCLNEDNEQKKHDFRSTELVLVGYAYYSGLLVSRIKPLLVHFLAEKKINLQINHIIIDNENEINLNFYFRRILPKYCHARKLNPKSKTYFSIITPISSTLTTPIKIENEFHRQLSDFCKHSCSEREDNECQICLADLNSEKKLEEICRIADFKELFDFHSIPFQTLVVVGNGELEEYPDDDKQTQKLSLGFWKNIVFKEPLDANLGRYITTQNKVKNYEDRINQFNLYIKSQWENIYSCKKCFPGDILKESPLFYADKTLVAPDFSYSMPDVDCDNEKSLHNSDPFFLTTSAEDDDWKIKKKILDLSIENSRPVITMDCIKHGHFVGTYKHFYFYFDYLRFFDLNEERIRQWALLTQDKIMSKPDIKKIYISNICNLDDKSKTLNYITRFDKILLITPNKSSSGTFAYLINKYVFNERCSIISFDPYDENINDFALFFKDWLRSNKPNRTFVYYIDNLITKGNTALKVHDIIKYTRKEKLAGESEGLAGIFTMISRLERFDAYNIRRKFKISYSDSPFTGIFAFAKINHPVIEAQIAKMDENNCYLCNDLNKYREIAKSCNLDNIREYVNSNNILKRIIQSKHEENLRLKPPYDNNKFLRLMVTHELYKVFCNTKKNEYFRKTDFSLDDFISDFKNKFTNNNYLYISKYNERSYFEQELRTNIIKVLAENPFVIHRDIKKTVFRWILHELSELIDRFIEDCRRIEEKEISEKEKEDKAIKYIFKYRYIRMLYKKAAQLNANFIIRKATLLSLFILSAFEEENYKVIIDFDLKKNSKQYSKQLSNFRIFIVAAIKESLYNNEPKSINLEENIKHAYEEFKLLQKVDQPELSLESPKRLYESILLENNGVIRQAYSSWDKFSRDSYVIRDYADINLEYLIDGIVNDINNIIDDTKIDNLRRFIFSSHAIEDKCKFSKDNESKSFIYSLALYNLLKEYKNKSELETNDTQTNEPEKVILLFLTMLCEIMGVDISNGGAFLLLKYQNINRKEISNDDLVVFGKVGKHTEDLTQYLETRSNSFTKIMLNGLPFLPNSSENKYYWTGISALKKENHWILQNSEKDSFNYPESDFAESRSKLEESPKRFYFFRICHWNNENNSETKTVTTPQAVLVFYDNQLEKNKQSAIEFDITQVRYALGLKNELSEFIQNNLINDSFKSLIENKKRLQEYIYRYNKNTHDAYFRVFEVLKIAEKNPIIYAMCSDSIIGKLHYSYLIGNKIDFYVESKPLSDIFNESYIKLITEFLESYGLCKQNIKFDTDTFLNKMSYYVLNYTKPILFQLFLNIVRHSKGYHDGINVTSVLVYSDDTYLVIENTNADILTIDINELTRNINSRFVPLNSVSLYIINRFCQRMTSDQRDVTIIRPVKISDDTIQFNIPIIKKMKL